MPALSSEEMKNVDIINYFHVFLGSQVTTDKAKGKKALAFLVQSGVSGP